MAIFSLIPAGAILLAIALVAAVIVGHIVSKKQDLKQTRRIASLLLDMAFVGIIVARLGFVALWWQNYWQEPLAILYLGDGGYLIWLGALAAMLFGAWRVRRAPQLWYALGSAVVMGWGVWVMAGAVQSLAQRASSALPDVEMTRLDGQNMQLATLTDKPMVINLWATWCAPCRREMPMLEQAQQTYTDVTFIFANQLQGRAAVEDYLQQQQLKLSNVLIDMNGTLAAHVGSQALPTTVFVDANGRVLDTHIGILSAAGLANTLKQYGMTAQK